MSKKINLMYENIILSESLNTTGLNQLIQDIKKDIKLRAKVISKLNLPEDAKDSGINKAVKKLTPINLVGFNKSINSGGLYNLTIFTAPNDYKADIMKKMSAKRFDYDKKSLIKFIKLLVSSGIISKDDEIIFNDYNSY